MKTYMRVSRMMRMESIERMTRMEVRRTSSFIMDSASSNIMGSLCWCGCWADKRCSPCTPKIYIILFIYQLYSNLAISTKLHIDQNNCIFYLRQVHEGFEEPYVETPLWEKILFQKKYCTRKNNVKEKRVEKVWSSIS